MHMEGRHVTDLHALRLRMPKRDFAGDDPRYECVANVAAAVNDLHAQLFCRREMDGKGFTPER